MAFDGTDSCWLPDVPTEHANEWRMRTTAFGDGYKQRTLDGINALDHTWNVTFAMRSATVLNAMQAYLENQKGRAFAFKEMQTGLTHSVWCDAWRINWQVHRRGGPPTKDYGTLTAEFVKAYGVTA